MIRIIAALIAAAPLAATARDVPATMPPASETSPAAPTPADSGRREGLYVGVGTGATYLGGSLATTRKTAAMLTIRAGMARSERLLLGVEGAFARSAYEQVSYVDLGATWFPWRRWAFVRGALGVTTIAHQDATTERGPNLLVGLGLEVGRPSGASVTLNAEAQLHEVAVAGESAGRPRATASAWIGVDWY